MSSPECPKSAIWRIDWYYGMSDGRCETYHQEFCIHDPIQTPHSSRLKASGYTQVPTYLESE